MTHRCEICNRPTPATRKLVQRANGTATYVGKKCYREVARGEHAGFSVFPQTFDATVWAARHTQAQAEVEAAR